MKTVKVSEATDLALNWLVAKCQGFAPFTDGISWIVDDAGTYKLLPEYSTNWSQGGPIIEREEIGTRGNAPCFKGREWEASPTIMSKGAGGKWGYGPTPLIAAMRCYVASKLGETVEVPNELNS